MASGFCFRVLLLPLMIYGQLALGNVHRHGSQIGPHPEQTRALWAYDSVPSNYDSVHPRASQKFPDVSKPFETITRQRPSHHFSGQVDSYSPSGSVSSYKPASFHSSPRQTPRSGSYQNEPRMWESKSQSDRKGSNVVSSGAIVMQFAPPPQQQSSEGNSGPWADASTVYSPGMLYTGKLPLNHPAVLQSKEGMWGSVSASNAHTHPGELPLTHPAFSAPAVLQSEEGQWDSVFASRSRPVFSAPATPQFNAGTQDGISSSSAQSLGTTFPIKPHQIPTPVQQGKTGKWDSAIASRAQSSRFINPEEASKNPEPQAQQGKSVPASNLQSPRLSNFAKLPMTHPAFSAPAGLQDGVYSSNAQSPNVGSISFRPEASSFYPLKHQPRMMGKPQLVNSFPQSNRGGFGDKAQVNLSPRSVKLVPVSSSRSGQRRQQQTES